MDNPELMAPCGTYCGVCPWRIAYITKDENLKAKLVKMIPGMKTEQIICEGCRSDLPLYFCKSCTMKICVNKKGIESCAKCEEEYPCSVIKKYPFKEFLIRQKWDIEYRKDHSDEDWLAKTIEMNSCPSCGKLQHWRAKICKSCGGEMPKRY